MIRILFGLGSNRSYQNLSSEQLLLGGCVELFKILDYPQVSSVYRTKAMYVEDQNDFYNMAVLGYINDDEDPFLLLEKIHEIEAKYGRDRTKEIRFGPRSLDIDIELFGDKIINTPDLQIPHIRIKERAFVLIPSIEVLKDSEDAELIEKYKKYLKEIKNQEDIKAIKLLIDSKTMLDNISQKVVKDGTNI